MEVHRYKHRDGHYTYCSPYHQLHHHKGNAFDMMHYTKSVTEEELVNVALCPSCKHYMCELKRAWLANEVLEHDGRGQLKRVITNPRDQ
jgi:hypothetical protein